MIRSLPLVLVLLLPGCAGARRISGGSGAFEVSLAALPTGLAAAWYDDRDGNAEIYLRRLDADGRPRSPEFRITTDPDLSYEPDAASLGDAIAVGWYEMTPEGGYRSRIALVDADGNVRWNRTISDPERFGRNVVVRSSDGDLFAAWIERDPDGTTDVRAGWWSLDGESLVAGRRIAAAGPTTWNLNAAVAGDGAFWLVFDGDDGTDADELVLARVGRTAESVTPLSVDDGFASKYPDLSFGPGRVALTWWDVQDGNEEVYLFVGAPEDLAGGVEDGAYRVTRNASESIGAYVAWNGPRVGLAWNDDLEGQHEIYFQTFDEDGRPLASARRLTRTPTHSAIPAILPWGDGFALAWHEYTHEMTTGQPHAGGQSEIVLRFVR